MINEMFEDTKGIIRSRNSKKNINYICHKEKDQTDKKLSTRYRTQGSEQQEQRLNSGTLEW